MKAFLNSRVVKKALYAAEETRRDDILRRVIPLLKNGKKIVDIGCGFCRVAEGLIQKGFSVTPVDVRDISIVPEITPVVYDGKTLPFKDKEFDYALIVTVLHHVKDQEELLLEVSRISQRMVIMEDVYEGGWQKVATYIMDSLLNLEFIGHPHTNRTDGEWKQLFQKHKMKVESSSIVPFWGIFRSALYVIQTPA
jgi:ubiquinone/menaquinone biosynthesis C-methylase UbiE